MIEIIMISKILLICWLITRFQPLQMILDILPDNLILNIFKLLLSCLMCLSTWTILIITGSLFLAAAGAFIAFWYDKLIGPYELRIKF